MQVWMPVQNLAKRLNRRDHAGHDIVSAQQTANFCPDAVPGTVSQLSQQPAIKPRVHAQTFGDRQHDLPMRYGSADVLRHVDRGQQGALLVTGGTRTPLLAGESDKHLVLTVGTADSREALLQIAALEKRCHAAVDDRSPESVLGLIAFIVGLPERVKMLIQQLPQVGGLRITWLVEG